MSRARNLSSPLRPARRCLPNQVKGPRKIPTVLAIRPEAGQAAGWVPVCRFWMGSLLGARLAFRGSRAPLSFSSTTRFRRCVPRYRVIAYGAKGCNIPGTRSGVVGYWEWHEVKYLLHALLHGIQYNRAWINHDHKRADKRRGKQHGRPFDLGPGPN